MVQFLSRNLLTDEPFDSFHIGQFFGHKQGEGIALRGGTSRPTNPVNVVFRMLGYVIVDDMGYAGDIQPAGGDIRGHENWIFAGSETGQGFGSFPLGTVGVKDAYRVREVRETAGDPVGTHAGTAKNNHALVLGFFQ